MKSIVADLWNGDIVPNIDCGQDDEQIILFSGLMKKYRDELDGLLHGELNVLFNKYNDCISEHYTRLTKHAFRDGFSIATKLKARGVDAIPHSCGSVR